MVSLDVRGRIRFRMLGVVEVLDGDGAVHPDLRARPKSLALLAFLALETRHGGCSRDRVLGHFWPDSTMAAARGAMRQALYDLRQALGPGVIRTRGQHELGLNREQFTADAVELLELLEAGRVQAAAELYRGELLPGLYFHGASPEFEAWLEGERESLRTRLVRGLWDAHAAAAAADDRRAALALGKRALELDPFHEAGLRRVMTLLQREGEDAEALQLFRRFRHRLSTELELTCSPETEALAARIAARDGAAGLLVRPGPDLAEAAPEPNAMPPEPVAPPAPPPVRSPVATGPRPRFWRRREARLAAGAGVLVAAVVGAWLVLGGGGTGGGARALAAARLADPPVVAPPGGGGRLVLGPIESPASDPVAGVAVASALTWLLAGQEVGAGGRLSGRIAPQAGGWELDLTLSGGPEEVRIATYVPGGLVSVVRHLETIMAAALDLPGEGRDALLPANEPALRALLRGEWLLERGEAYGAMAAFQQAVGFDPGFALAYHHLSLAASLASEHGVAEQAERVALALHAGLPEPEALIVEARQAVRGGGPAEAEALLASVLAMRPDHPEASYQAAEILFRHNPLRGRPLAEARPALDRASARGMGRASALYLSGHLALLAGDLPAFDRATAASLELAPAGVQGVQVRALRARVLGSEEEWRGELARLGAVRDQVVAETARDLAVFAGDVPAALAALEVLTRVDRSPRTRAWAHASRADLLAAAGRPTQVAAELRLAMAAEPVTGASRAAHLLTLGVLPPDHPALQAVARAVLDMETPRSGPESGWPAPDPMLEPWLLPYARALAAHAIGDPAPARTLTRQLGTLATGDPARRVLRSGLALRLGEPMDPEDREASAVHLRGLNAEEAALSPFLSRPLVRLAYARQDRDLRRLRQADRWLVSLLEHSIPDLALAAVALGERARTAELRRDPVGARQAMERLDRLQQGAEASYLEWRNRQAWATGSGSAAAEPGASAERPDR
jgi:DNA-binding SARP family transcriptional activator/tetratricopeptide (TPR) repeat protein